MNNEETMITILKKMEKINERITTLHERYDKIDKTDPVYKKTLSKLMNKISDMERAIEQKNITNERYQVELSRDMMPRIVLYHRLKSILIYPKLPIIFLII